MRFTDWQQIEIYSTDLYQKLLKDKKIHHIVSEQIKYKTSHAIYAQCSCSIKKSSIKSQFTHGALCAQLKPFILLCKNFFSKLLRKTEL